MHPLDLLSHIFLMNDCRVVERVRMACKTTRVLFALWAVALLAAGMPASGSRFLLQSAQDPADPKQADFEDVSLLG